MIRNRYNRESIQSNSTSRQRHQTEQEHKWAAAWQNQKMAYAPSQDRSAWPVWPESSLAAWRKLGSLASHWARSEDSDQTGRMPRLIGVFAGHTVILLVLPWGGSLIITTQAERQKGIYIPADSHLATPSKDNKTSTTNTKRTLTHKNSCCNLPLGRKTWNCIMLIHKEMTSTATSSPFPRWGDHFTR